MILAFFVFLSLFFCFLPFDLYAISPFHRQLEQEAETVVRVLQPGPLGIIEHKFSAEEINEANATVRQAVEAWRRSAELEKRNPFLRDYIESWGKTYCSNSSPCVSYFWCSVQSMHTKSTSHNIHFGAVLVARNWLLVGIVEVTSGRHPHSFFPTLLLNWLVCLRKDAYSMHFLLVKKAYQ